MTKLPRPSLAWMSVEDLNRVRDRLIGLFMSPDQALSVAPPEGFFGVKEVVILGGPSPVFGWEKYDLGAYENQGGTFEVRRSYKAWLKISSWKPPYFDFQIDDNEIVPLPFNSEEVRLPIALLKHYSRHFPFKSTDNYFINNGEFVA